MGRWSNGWLQVDGLKGVGGLMGRWSSGWLQVDGLKGVCKWING